MTHEEIPCNLNPHEPTRRHVELGGQVVRIPKYSGKAGSKSIWRARHEFTKAVSTDDVYAIARRLVGIALESPDEKTAIEAAKFIYAYRIGKPRQEIEVTTNSTLSIDERKLHVYQMLNIDPNDASLQFGTAKGQRGDIENHRASPLALPEAVPAGHEPVPDLGEVEAGGDNVGERSAERDEEVIEGEAAGPSVQLSGPSGGE